ncbi:MAG TPA: DUF1064 domain-containing protein [Pseudoneobacillus sp.]|nr:DUF1064 domain-containing protein [Pseudoneobacillus sp.]
MSKFGAKKVTIDGIKFDSKMEADYYLVLLKSKELGLIKDFELQPKFELQESFRKRGKLFRKIEYRADFKVISNNDEVVIVDVKGFETTDFKIKRKLFEKKYPYELKLITFVKKYGGWVDVDELKQLRKNNS